MISNGIKIGNIFIHDPAFLAPMAGITDKPFRRICREHGAGLVYTEMVSAKGVEYGEIGRLKGVECRYTAAERFGDGAASASRKLVNKSLLLSELDEDERPAAVQIFGSEPGVMARTAAIICEAGQVDILDINMGCPAPKIVKGGGGSALMKNPSLAADIINAVRSACGGKIPVTVKFRLGWDSDSINAVEFAKMAESCGAAAICVHGRTREQFYSGQADWNMIKAVKEAVSIPVIGNGDIFVPSDAVRLLEHSGCDAVMSGRGAQGNPWLFTGINMLLNDIREINKKAAPNAEQPERLTVPDGYDIRKYDISYRPSDSEIYETVIRHLNMLTQLKGEHLGLLQMRKHIAWYIKGKRGASALRDAIFKSESKDEVLSLIATADISS